MAKLNTVNSNIFKTITIFLLLLNHACTCSSIEFDPDPDPDPDFQFEFETDTEFSKDIASLVTESTQESRCEGNIFIFTEECAEHTSYSTESMSTWAPPVILLSYESSFKNLTKDDMQKWYNYMRWKGKPCSLIFICDLSQTSNISMKFLDYPKLIRNFDQVLYFSDFDFDFENGFGWRVLEAERSILKYTEILLGVKVVKRTPGSESLMKISSICSYCKTGMDYGTSETLGTWQRNRTMLANFFKVFAFQNSANFNDFRFRIGYLNYKPHFICHYNRKAKGNVCTGVEWEMLRKIGKSLNFSYDLLNYTNQGHGVVYTETNITGMVGSIKNNSIDFALGGVSVTPERMQVVDFTKIFAHEPIVFVVEKRNDIYILGIWLAFQPEVWPIIILTIICISILFKLILKRNYDLSLTHGFQFTIGSLLGQPLNHPYVTRNGRLLMKLILGVWWFVCITIGILYNTSLITSLINPVSPKEPESLHDLLQLDYKFVMGCKQGVVFELLHSGAQDDHGAFQLIRDRLLPNIEEETSSGLIAYVMEESAVEEIDWRAMYGFKQIKIIKERLFLTGYAWAMKQEAPYKEKIDTALGRLASAGLIDYWYSKYSHQGNEPTEAKFRIRKKLGQIHLNLEILQGAFIFLLLGCGLAGIVFLIELWHKHYTCRLLTWKEVKFWFNHYRDKLNVQTELIRIGYQQSLLLVAPLEVPNEVDANKKMKEKKSSRFGRNRPELIYLK